MAIQKNYSPINFRCPRPVSENAAKGLQLRREFGRGGSGSTEAKAQQQEIMGLIKAYGAA